MYVGRLDPASNRASYRITFELTDDDDDGALVDLSGASIVFEFVDPSTGCSVLSASTGDGITIADTGAFTVVFARDDMAGLDAGTLNVGCTIEINDETYQAIIGSIQILDGIVQQ